MRINERREKQKQATKHAIMSAARQIAQQEGWSAVTVRRIADKVEYTPPIVYEYFANKEALLTELLREGFRLLIDAMREAAETPMPQQERVLSITSTYWNFAQNHWDLYQVMHGLSGIAVDAAETARAAQESCAVPLMVLEDWAHENNISLPDPMGAVEILWSLLHGLITTTKAGRVAYGERLAHQAVADLLTAWSISGKSRYEKE